MSKRKVRVAHWTPGRIRLKVAHAKGDSERLHAVARSFGGIREIENVDVNSLTGSLVLNYDPDKHAEFERQFERRLAQIDRPLHRPPETELDLFTRKIESEAEFLAERSAGVRIAVDFCKQLDREIKIASGNNVDLKLLLAGGIIAATVFEIGATAATPVWVTLSLFAMNHFIELHQQPLKPAAVAP
jgi:Heavy metal associated domain 2